MEYTHYFKHVLIISISMALAGHANAQTASWCTDTCGIMGTDNSAFGAGVLVSAANPSGENTAVGTDAIGSLVIGWRNTGVGYRSLFNTASVPFNGGEDNAAIGHSSLLTNVSGEQNAAAGNSSMYSNTEGDQNAAGGMYSLYFNTSGSRNAALGHSALYTNTDGADNVGVGFQSLFEATSGNQNTVVGNEAFHYVEDGEHNTAIGHRALHGTPTAGSNSSYNTGVGHSTLLLINDAYYNTALGSEALLGNGNGWYNVAIGSGAAYNNLNCNTNVAVGVSALYENQNGSANTAVGVNTMWKNQSHENTAVGASALYWNAFGNGYQNTALGSCALNIHTFSAQNTALGAYADTKVAISNATMIGYLAKSDAVNKVRIGNTAVTVIEGQVAPSWPSDERFKFDISEEDVKGLEFIVKLRPVVYNFDTKKFTQHLVMNDPENVRAKALAQDFGPSTSVRQSGFIAQEVEQAAEEVGYDFNGVIKPAGENGHYSVAYCEFVVPLVKAIQEQQKILEELNTRADELLGIHDQPGQKAEDLVPQKTDQ